MPRKLILDVDTGTDDAVAIMLAALHPDEMSPREALEALYALKAKLPKG